MGIKHISIQPECTADSADMIKRSVLRAQFLCLYFPPVLYSLAFPVAQMQSLETTHPELRDNLCRVCDQSKLKHICGLISRVMNPFLQL